MTSGRRLAVYVTSHGFGHLNRTAAVLNRVPADVPVTIRSHSNLFEHWRERLKRPAELEHYVSDAGAVNPPGDSAATDPVATLELAMRFHGEAMARLDDQVRRLREQETAAVLCDAPAVPLVAARRAGVPGFLMSNFTWADIYAPYARAVGGEAMRFVADLRACYRQATATFRVEPAMSMSWLSPMIEPGMVVNQGRDRSGELRRLFGLKKTDKLVYLYIGRYGQNDLDWSRLRRFAAQGVHFLGYQPEPPGKARQLPRRPLGRLARRRSHRLERCHRRQGRLRDRLRGDGPRHADDLSSSERVCRISLTRPRLARLGRRSADLLARLLALELDRALASALEIRPGPAPFPADGAKRIAGHLTALCRPSRDQKVSVVVPARSTEY